MADHFDPYYKWLGISPEKQPPNLYQLLAVDEFESDPDVIESAADQRMAHLRTFQSSKRGKLSQQLLNEISAARVTLLKPDKKEAYDEQLRQELGAAADDPLGPSSDQPTGGTTLPAPASLASQHTTNVPGPFVTTKPVIKKKPAWILPVGISVSALVILGVVIVIILVASNKDEGEGTVSEQTAPQQTDQSRHDRTNGGKTDDSTGIPKISAGNSVDGQADSGDVDGSKDGTANNGETSNRVKTNDEPPAKTDTTTPETTGTNGTSTPPVEPPKPIEIDAPKKQPLPTDEQQKPVLTTLEETFKLSEQRSKEEQLKLAGDFLTLADKSADPIEKFVLLRGTISLASNGGDATLVMRAVDAIDRQYQIDRFDVGQKALIGFCEHASTKEAFGSLKDTANKFNEEAIAAGHVDLAMSLAEAVYSAMVKKSVASEFRKQAYEERNRISELYERWKTIQDALAKLVANPDAPDANLIAGQWYCFEKDNWELGLPMLAKSGDQAFKSVAQEELFTAGDSVEDQIAMGDAWWNLAEDKSADSLSRESMRSRSVVWYRKALPKLSGLEKIRAETRVTEFAESPSRENGPSATDAIGWVPIGSEGNLTQCYKLGSFPRNGVDDRQVLLFLSRAKPGATFQGFKLVPTASTPGDPGAGQLGQIFWGPAKEQRDHVMYFVFGIQSDSDQIVNLDTNTFTRWEHSVAKTFLDFQPVPNSGKIPLKKGKHTLVVIQHHKKSDRPGRSWVSVTVLGKDLKQASTVP